jgi:hypothetical protein
MADDQHEVIDFLSTSSSYRPAVERVNVIETHALLVFLAGDRANKLKRAVKYLYLDFSTAGAEVACEAEFTLNRRTAPEIYLEIRALTRVPDGRGRLHYRRAGGRLARGHATLRADIIVRRPRHDRPIERAADERGRRPFR